MHLEPRSHPAPTAVAALRAAGEGLFRALIPQSCGNGDPRHPRNDDCFSCTEKALAMDAWDRALMRSSGGER